MEAAGAAPTYPRRPSVHGGMARPSRPCTYGSGTSCGESPSDNRTPLQNDSSRLFAGLAAEAGRADSVRGAGGGGANRMMLVARSRFGGLGRIGDGSHSETGSRMGRHQANDGLRDGGAELPVFEVLGGHTAFVLVSL